MNYMWKKKDLEKSEEQGLEQPVNENYKKMEMEQNMEHAEWVDEQYMEHD